MKKWIIIFISVIILFILFLFRFEYTTIGGCLVRINRITGTAKVFQWQPRSGRFELYKYSSSRRSSRKITFDSINKKDWNFGGLEKDKGIDAILEHHKNK